MQQPQAQEKVMVKNKMKQIRLMLLEFFPFFLWCILIFCIKPKSCATWWQGKQINSYKKKTLATKPKAKDTSTMYIKLKMSFAILDETLPFACNLKDVKDLRNVFPKCQTQQLSDCLCYCLYLQVYFLLCLHLGLWVRQYLYG